MSARNWWLESDGPDEREERLPMWARDRLKSLRRTASRLMEGVVEKRARTEDDRVALSLGPDGLGGSLVRVLENSARVTFEVSGGEMSVQLSQFGSRFRVRITGQGDYDHLLGERSEIAVLPALGNVVEVNAASERQTYRDVDVRLMLDDAKHDRLRKAIGRKGIPFLGLAIGQYLTSLTDLPIDFQIQRMTEANHYHGDKMRNSLGSRTLSNFVGDAPPLPKPVPELEREEQR